MIVQLFSFASWTTIPANKRRSTTGTGTPLTPPNTFLDSFDICSSTVQSIKKKIFFFSGEPANCFSQQKNLAVFFFCNFSSRRTFKCKVIRKSSVESVETTQILNSAHLILRMFHISYSLFGGLRTGNFFILPEIRTGNFLILPFIFMFFSFSYFDD